MFTTLFAVKAYVQSFLQNEKGVVAWEYLLVIAGVSVAIIFAVAFAAPSLTSAVLNGTCEAINTVLPTTTGGTATAPTTVSSITCDF